MAKKLALSLAIVILSFCCGITCLAAENNNDSNVNLGREVTDSLDKAGSSVQNVADDVMDGTRNAVNGAANVMDNMTRGNTNQYNANGGNREGYNAVRTSVDEVTTGNMSTTTWIWIILAVAAIVIVAMVWYYAVKGNDDE